MPCLLAILVVAFPRIAILLLYFLTDFFRGVYDTVLVPVLGFIFMPLTLVAYTYLTKSGQPMARWSARCPRVENSGGSVR